MMDHPPDEKPASRDTIQDDKMENLDKGHSQKTETLASEKADEFMEEVQPDSGNSLKDQNIDTQSNNKEDNNSAESVEIQINLTDTKTGNNQSTERQNIEEENIQDAETEIIGEIEIQKETERTQEPFHMESNRYDSSDKSLLKTKEDNRKIVPENICTADSTTDENTIIIDLCGDDQIEMYEQKDIENIPASNISLERNIEFNSKNKATLENVEDNKKTIDTIIIDLCDDQSETDEPKDGDTQADSSLKNEGGNFSRSMPCRVETEPIEMPLPIQIVESPISDDSESDTEIQARAMKDVTNVELNTYEITDQSEHEEIGEITTGDDESEEARELTNEDEPKKTCQMTGKGISIEPCKTQLKCHPEGVDPDVEKDINLTGNDNNDQGCLATVSVNIEEKSEASMIKDKSDETEIRKINKEFEIENFRFKDDIITLQEDYGVDSKQVGDESSYNLEKSDIVSEAAKFTILDENDSEKKQCDTTEELLGCGHEDETERNTRIGKVPQCISKFDVQETISKVKREETKRREKIEHEQDFNTGVNELEDITLILIKKETENFGSIDKKENKPSTIEKSENSSKHSETIHKQSQHEDNIQMASTSESANNVKLAINLDIVKSKKNYNSFTINPNGIPGCTEKGDDLKDFQTETSEGAQQILSVAYLNDTPPSHSDCNEEFFDAVEYIPETKEISIILKPCTALLSTPCLNLMNEPIPGPSGISTMKNRAETPVGMFEEDFLEATEYSSDEDTKLPEVEKNTSSEKISPRDDSLKLKESRKHEVEEEDEKENIKKMKFD